MKRSAGVTAIAVLAVIGSLGMIAMAALMAVIPFLGLPSSRNAADVPPDFFKAIALIMAFVYLLPAIWGIVTSVGLFRLKEWARISTIVFSVLMVMMSFFALAGVILMPLPTIPNQPADGNAMAMVRAVMAAMMAVPLGMGVWWLVFLTRPRVKLQFSPAGGAVNLTGETSLVEAAGQATPPIPKTPVSITIIACLMLLGCLSLPLCIVLRTPVAVLTKVVTGWPAAVYIFLLGAIQAYIAIGLLRLKPMARTAAVAFQSFFVINGYVVYFAPGGRARMLEIMQRSTTWPHLPGSDAAMAFTRSMAFFFLIGGCVVIAGLAQLYFLVTLKEAFESAAAARRSQVQS